jgi:hypothetical protein
MLLITRGDTASTTIYNSRYKDAIRHIKKNMIVLIVFSSSHYI